MDTNTHTEQLPTTIRASRAQEARDADAALALLTRQAVISDIGESFSGDEALRRFVSEAERSSRTPARSPRWIATARSGWSASTLRATSLAGRRTWTIGSRLRVSGSRARHRPRLTAVHDPQEYMTTEITDAPATQPGRRCRPSTGSLARWWRCS